MANSSQLRFPSYDPYIDKIISDAIDNGKAMGHNLISTEHLLSSFLGNVDIKSALEEMMINVDGIRSELQVYLEANAPIFMSGDEGISLTGALIRILETTAKTAVTNQQTLTCGILLKSILDFNNSYVSYFLKKYGVTEAECKELDRVLGKKSSDKENSKALNEFCINMNEFVKDPSKCDPLIGRKEEIARIAHTLLKKKKGNAILVGDPGVGKSAIAEGLAMAINDGDIPKGLKDKILYSMDIGGLLAGCRYRGDFEDKIKSILASLEKTPNAILFLDEAEHINAGEGASGSGVSFSGMFKPFLSRSSVKVIAATTYEGYRKAFEKDTALMRRFNVIYVNEPSVEESIEIVKGIASGMEDFHKVKIADDVAEACVKLSVKYMTNLHLPDKAIDILDSACARTKINGIKNVDTKAIIREIEDFTGITIKSENSEDTKSQILELEEKLNSKVYHQEEAVNELYKAIVRSKAGLRNMNSPIGKFLFVGPSGCGKTYLAQCLAQELQMPFIRYDMSEYQEKHTVSRLIGSTPGYVGYGDGAAGEGLLINDGIKHPGAIFLIDEVEKAHPDIFNVFLNIFDNGMATGGTGKVANFRNSIFILTSNLGTNTPKDIKVGYFAKQDSESKATKAVNGFFRTELRGRLNAVVEFHPLDDLSYRMIVVDAIREMEKPLSITLTPNEELINHILELNIHSEYGARNIKKIVEDIISFPLSLEFLNGKIRNGSNVSLGWNDAKLEIMEVKKSHKKKATLLND